MQNAYDSVVSELRAAGLGYALDAPNPICLPALAMTAVPCEPTDIPHGASCIGGAPDLPRGYRWPRRTVVSGGRWLTFLAQISLAEVAAAGLVSFVLDLDRLTGSGGLGDFDSLEVLYFQSDASLFRTLRPTPLRDPNPAPCPELRASRLEFALVPSLSVTSDLRREDYAAFAKVRIGAASARTRPLH
jgi:Domain of unknown function (DUF1963)